MQIYNFHPVTGEYINTSIADRSPLDLEEVVYLIPANASEVAPPEASEHEVAVFDGAAWSIQIDKRGIIHYDEDGNSETILQIGEDVPEGRLLDKPAPKEILPTEKLINRVQFKSMLALMGKTTDDVLAAIDAVVEDPTQNTIAKVKVTDSERYARDNELFTLLAPSLSLTDAQIDAAWEQAILI